MNNHICFECGKEIKPDQSEQGYQVFDEAVRQVLGFGSEYKVFFHAKECYDHWKSQNKAILDSMR